MSLPLEGVRIVDLSAIISGPMATQILADQGADVIKVERPGVGDATRCLETRPIAECRGDSLVRALVDGGDDGRRCGLMASEPADHVDLRNAGSVVNPLDAGAVEFVL